MQKKRIVIIGAVVVCLMASGLLLFSGGKRKEKTGKLPRESESTGVNFLEEGSTSAPEETTTEIKDDSRLTFYNLVYLYRLDDNKRPEFKKQFENYLTKEKISANSVQVLVRHEEHDKQPEKPAVFYMQTNDRKHTVFKVLFDKKKKTFSFEKIDKPFENIMDYGGMMQGDATETEDGGADSEGLDGLSDTDVKIEDQDDALASLADINQVQVETKKYLQSIEEDRRNLYVVSAGKTKRGWEAELDFENVRSDLKKLYVVYDGSCHFSLKKGN